MTADRSSSDWSYLNDPSLHHGVVQPKQSVVSVLAPRHGHEPEARAPPVVIDDLDIIYVAEPPEEDGQIVLPEPNSQWKGLSER